MRRFRCDARLVALSLVLIVAPAVSLPAAGRQNDHEIILKLAASGKVDDAWHAWSALPPGPDTLRLGVRIAAEAGQIDYGLDLYEKLTAVAGPSDPDLLKTLAVGTARRLASSNDRDVRIVACGAALILAPSDPPCRTALEQLAEQDGDPAGRVLGGYALINAGIRQTGAIPTGPELDWSTRLRVAQVFRRLPTEERLAMIRPLFEHADPAVVYQTLLLAADLPGTEVLAALAGLQPPRAVRMGLTIALARHGDRASLDQAVAMLDGIDGYEKVQVGRALVESLDPRGLEIIDQVLKGPVDIDRVDAAIALARINPASAGQTIVETLTRGSAAVRSSALYAAGLVRIGAEPAVYRRLVDDEEMVRAFAVEAITNTFVPLPAQPLPLFPQ